MRGFLFLTSYVIRGHPTWSCGNQCNMVVKPLPLETVGLGLDLVSATYYLCDFGQVI